MARTTINTQVIPDGTIVSADLSYPLTNFSSTGIDDNASSTALTIDSSGNISVTGTVDGRDLATDGTKLDGIAASATNYGDSDVATYISGDRTYGNITTTGYIAGPSTFTIDPAAVGDNTGTLVVAGNLQVDGTTTTINSTTMTVDDLNITLASGAANAAAANGAGITVDGASAALTYNGTNDDWNFNKTLNVTGDLSLVDSPFPRITLSDSDGTNQKTLIDQSGGFASLTAWNDSSHGTLDFKSYDNTTTRLNMRIDSNGNVGIGVTDPDVDLEVQSAAGTLKLSNDVAKSATEAAVGQVEFAQHFGVNVSSSIAGIEQGGATDYAQGGMVFKTRPSGGSLTERMRIDSSGNLLIGGTGNTFSAKVAIAGSLTVGSGLTSTSIYFDDSNASTSRYRLTSSLLVEGDFAAMKYNGSSWESALYIDENRNVGIGGATNPNDRLVIQYGDDASGSQIRLGNQEINIIDRYQSSDYSARIWGQWPGYGILRFGVNDGAGAVTTSDLAIRGNGNIGINTDDPQSVISSSRILQIGSGGNTTISIRSTDGVNDRSAILELLSTGNGGSKSVIIYGDTDTTPGSPSPLSIQSYHSGVRTERVHIDSDGNVGIGIEPRDGYKLEVPGLAFIGNVASGAIPNSQNNNSELALLHKLGQGQGFQFSGMIYANSWTGNNFATVHILANYTYNTTYAQIINQSTSGASVSTTNVSIVVATYDGASWVGIQKTGGGTGILYLNGLLVTNMVNHGGVRAITSGYTVTSTLASF